MGEHIFLSGTGRLDRATLRACEEIARSIDGVGFIYIAPADPVDDDGCVIEDDWKSANYWFTAPGLGHPFTVPYEREVRAALAERDMLTERKRLRVATEIDE